MTTCELGKVFKVALSQSRPLVNYDKKEGRIVGMLGDFLLETISSCCHDNATLNVSRITKHPQQLLVSMKDDEDIILPYTQLDSFKFDIPRSYVLPVLGSPGAVYLANSETQPTSANLANILSVTWQLLLIIIISCGFAGAFIWILDTFKNPETFPRNFHKGLWEGLWWAFVSMTTVGYGDLTPKSISGRLFAMVWILLGICICSIFTAALTAALTSVDNNRDTIQGRKVGVLNGTDECRLAALLGAQPVAFNSISELLKGLSDQNPDPIEGVIIDNAYVTDIFTSRHRQDLRMTIQIQSERVHGVLFQNSSAQLLDCVRKVGRRRQFDDKMMKMFVIKAESDDDKRLFKKIQGSVTMTNWLNVNNMYLAIYGSLLVVLCCILLLWEFVYWKPKQKASKSHQNGMPAVNFNPHTRTDMLKNRPSELIVPNPIFSGQI